MRRFVARGGRHNWNAGVLRGIVVSAGALVGRADVTVGRIDVVTLDGIPETFKAWATLRLLHEEAQP